MASSLTRFLGLGARGAEEGAGGAVQVPRSMGRQVSLKLAVRVALVILLMTSIAYFHVVSVIRERALESLAKYTTERGRREQVVFSLAERSHALIKAEAVAMLTGKARRNPDAAFNRFMVRNPDGTMRSRRDGFDGARDPFAFVGRDTAVDRRIRRAVMIAHDLTRRFGLAGRHSFQNVYFTMPENILVGYWPEFDRWAHDASSDLNIPAEEYFAVSTRQNNPARKTVWTGLFYDAPAKTWMMSAETPVDIGGRHVMTIGHDITLNELMERSAASGISGASTLVFRGDGRLIFDRARLAEIQHQKGAYHIDRSGDAQLKEAFRRVMARSPGDVIVRNEPYGTYLAVNHIPGPDLYFVTAYPEKLIESAAFGTARFILLLGFASLLLEVAIFSWVLRRDVTRPLARFITFADRLARGDFTVEADQSRRDEIGFLGRSFNAMASSLARATRDLRNSEDRFRDIAESSADWMWETGPDLRFTWVSPGVMNVLGNPADYHIGKARGELPLPEGQVDAWERHLENLRQHREVKNFRFTRKTPDGRRIHVEISEKPILGTDGEFLGYRGTGRDVTSRVEAEEAVARLNAELEQRVADRTAELHEAQAELVKNERLATLGRLAAMVSHELRNPLGAIASSLAVVNARSRGKDIGAEPALDRMQRAVVRCDRIIQEMLDYARARDISTAPIPFDTWLAEVLDELSAAPGIEVIRDLGAPGAVVAIDGERLRRAVINLHDNACQALEENRRKLAEDPWLRVKSRVSNGRLYLTFEDNGPGIADDVMANVFEPLFSTKAFGVGLGLPIVRQIIAEHGGDVAIESDRGEGTRVTVTLPLQQAAESG